MQCLSNAYIPLPYPLSPALPQTPATSMKKDEKGVSGESSGYGVMGMSICEYEYGYEYSISKKGPHPLPQLTQPVSELLGKGTRSPAGDIQNSHCLVGLFLCEAAGFGRM